VVYVAIASLLPGDRLPGRLPSPATRAVEGVLVLFIAPFWISHMMRMFAWINLLQPSGYVNRTCSARPIDAPAS
jgi:ABC-type spermidine/putrescine transport system permease subunit I